MTPAPTTGQRLAHAAVLATAALAGVLLAYCDTARAQHAGHGEFHDVYRGWRQPDNPAVSCCNAKYDDKGELREGGDCYPTVAELRQVGDEDSRRAAWFARRDTGEWIEVPRSRIIHELNPDDTGSRAHLCEREGRVICFVSPTGAI